MENFGPIFNKKEADDVKSHPKTRRIDFLPKRTSDKVSISIRDKALELHSKSLVIDGCQSSNFIDSYFKTVKEAGVTAAITTVAWTHNLYESIKRISAWYSKIDRNSDLAVFAWNVEHIFRAKKEGKVAYFFALQDTTPLEGDVNILDVLHRLGIGIIQLTYNEKNSVGDGCGERTNCGLSEFGIKVVGRMNKLDLIVDLSHTGDRTTEEAIELAEIPVFSHSNARALCENVRNKTDEQIRSVAEKGGIIGVNAFPSFVKRRRTEKGELPTVNDLLDHIEYIIRLVGVNYVGLGLDFIENATAEEYVLLRSRPDIWGLPTLKGVYEYASNIQTVSEIFNITLGLVARGYSDREIRKILGENWVRVLSRAG